MRDLCPGDNKPCYVSAGTDDAHFRCGTRACGQKTLHGFEAPSPLTEDALPTPQEDDAIIEFRQRIDEWLLAMQAEGHQPMVAAGQLLDVMVQVMLPVMGLGAIRTAMLMTYEKTYPQPMTFIERTNTKDLLDKISNARRKVEGKPYLMLPEKEPGGDDRGA